MISEMTRAGNFDAEIDLRIDGQRHLGDQVIVPNEVDH
jgi:hypothetical protein